MPDAFKQVFENGMVLKYFDTSQRRFVRTIDGRYDPGDAVFFIALIPYREIDAVGLATLFNRFQILAFPTAQWIKQYLVAVFTAQI